MRETVLTNKEVIFHERNRRVRDFVEEPRGRERQHISADQSIDAHRIAS